MQDDANNLSSHREATCLMPYMMQPTVDKCHNFIKSQRGYLLQDDAIVTMDEYPNLSSHREATCLMPY